MFIITVPKNEKQKSAISFTSKRRFRPAVIIYDSKSFFAQGLGKTNVKNTRERKE